MPRLDRSVPEHMRANTKMQRESNRKLFMDSYKKTIQDHEYNERKVRFTVGTIEHEFEREPELAL